MIAVTLVPILFFPTYYAYSAATLPQTVKQLMTFLLILSTMHIALTSFFYLDRDYRDHISRHKPFYIYFPAAMIILCGMLTQTLGKEGVVYLTIFYHAWLLFHYGRQNFGLMSFICLSQNAKPLGTAERVAFHLAPVGAILGAHAVLPEFKSALGSYAVLSWRAGLVLYGLAVLAVVYAGLYRRRDSALTLVYLLMLVLFWLPTFLFDSYAKAVLGYAVAHALQYFVFMYFSASGSRYGARQSLLLLGTGAVLGWLVIWLTRDHELWGGALMFMMGAELGLVMWHFIVDAGVWRLSQPWQRAQVK